VFDLIVKPMLVAGMEGKDTTETASTPPKLTSVVLVAEDNPGVRQLIRVTLEAFGCMVITAADGDEALALSRGFQGRITLLVADFDMPKMNGVELIEQLALERPNTASLLMSGALIRVCPDQPVLQKPFGLAQLTEAVQSLLNRQHTT
jgi:CheY-like chemotaxis protein